MSLEVILIVIVSLLLGIIVYLLTRQSSWEWTGIDTTNIKMLQDQIIALNKNIDYKLWESNRNTQRNLQA